MRVALIHDWLTGMRGGEKCLEALCEIYPDADLFTLVHAPGSVSPTIEKRRVVTSMLQSWPRATHWYRYYLPLMPTAIENLDLSDYDLVISSSHCVAKGVIVKPDALHICYSHTPMRYVWDQWPEYFPRNRIANRLVLPPVLNYLRSWDAAASARVDRFVANSRFVARRIEKYYRRSSTVVHPPVDTDAFHIGSGAGESYLMVTAMVPYKRVDVTIDAFNAMRRPLTIVGDGPLRRKLRARAGPTIEFAGWLDDERLADHYAGCRAVILPATEDFGIVPLEANASGRPVIALGRGGALDTVVPLNGPRQSVPGGETSSHPTGLFFEECHPDSLQSAVRLFEENERLFDPERLRDHARRFDRSVFKRRMQAVVEESLKSWEDPAASIEELNRPLAWKQHA